MLRLFPWHVPAGLDKGLLKMAVCIPDSDGRTLFHYAAATGKTHVSKYFMEQVKVDDVNMKDGRGITIITALILLIYLNAIQTKRSLESLKL